MLSGVYGFLADYLLWVVLFVSLLIHTFCFFRLFPRTRPRLRMVLGNALVGACMLGAVLLIAETYLRFLYVATDSFGVTLPARRWFLLHVEGNSAGYRDREWAMPKPPGVRRVAFLGDSFAWGWGVETPAHRFTDLLQKRFDRARPDTVEVLNLSRPGWDTGDQLRPLKDAMDRWQVDEIILCYVPNDIERLLPPDASGDLTKPPDLPFFNTDTSVLAEFLYYRIFIGFRSSVRHYHDRLADAYADPEIWVAQQERLRALARAARDRGRVFRVVLLPFLRTGGTRFDSAAVHQQLVAFLGSEGIDVLDLRPDLMNHNPATLTVNRWDPHPNRHAHALIAETLWKRKLSPEAGR